MAGAEILTITTELPDVVLRQFAHTDAEPYSALAQASVPHLEATVPHLEATVPHMIEEYSTPQGVLRKMAAKVERGALPLVIEEKGALVGGLDLEPTNEHLTAREVNYWVGMSFTHQRVATAAVRAAADYAQSRGFWAVRSYTLEAHQPSARVLRNVDFVPSGHDSQRDIMFYEYLGSRNPRAVRQHMAAILTSTLTRRQLDLQLLGISNNPGHVAWAASVMQRAAVSRRDSSGTAEQEDVASTILALTTTTLARVQLTDLAARFEADRGEDLLREPAVTDLFLGQRRAAIGGYIAHVLKRQPPL